MILPINTAEGNLENVGGKGANLAKLARAGYPVPGGYLIPTHAYHAYVAANNLASRILDRVATAEPDDPKAMQAASDDIREWFSSGTIPPKLSDALKNAYAGIEHPPVAVRSSATAEDLPEMSFAGQQDTFLNVVGEDALLEAVVNCWSSLWTARAISYRSRNAIPHQDVALAVVVQKMVPAEASGVLFTANPLTGLRTETVIDATLGLGEALVGGHVEPDHYVVDTTESQIVSKTLGAKAISMRGKSGGGVEAVDEKAAGHQALPDPLILELVRLGQRVAAEYDFPQDIEWAWAEGKLYLLQTRPITALFPLPEGMETEDFKLLVSFGAVQGILDPITPLGQDCIQEFLVVGGGRLLKYHITHETQKAIYRAGERLWLNLTPVCRNTIGRIIVPRVFALAEPTILQALDKIWDDPKLVSKTGLVRLSNLPRFAGFVFPFWFNALRAWRDPDGRRNQVQQQMEERISALQARSDAIEDSPDKLSQTLDLVRALSQVTPFLVFNGLATIVAGLIPLVLLHRIASHLPKSERNTDTSRSNLAFEINRGLPHNVTTEMDLYLWETARVIKSDPASASAFQESIAPELALDYLGGRLPTVAQIAITRFMKLYGMRGVGEIDIGRSRWREDPTLIMRALQSYLQFEDEAQAPGAVYARGKEVARAASAELEAAVRRTRGGRLKARVVRWAVRRFRALAGMRESPKFHIVRTMGVIREGLLECGSELVEAGTFTQPDDIFFLRLVELESLANGESQDWKTLVEDRRQVYEREKLRIQIPRLLLSDGRAFYEGLSTSIDDGDGVMEGSPVSPGMVEGAVRVVLDPREAQLEPGEILVCPGTDPAWTPLFLIASGLVMEVGGLMTHGAIVAREYGIPAVVGIHQATTCLKTGQLIRVDGTSGTVTIYSTGKTSDGDYHRPGSKR